MPDSNTSKKNFFISVAIILGVVGSYFGIFYLVSKFSDSFSLGHFLNSRNIMEEHRKELIAKIKRDSHFKNINAEEYVREVEQIITMDNHRFVGHVGWRDQVPIPGSGHQTLGVQRLIAGLQGL